MASNNNNAEQQRDSEPFPALTPVAESPPAVSTQAAPFTQVPDSSQPYLSQNGGYQVRRTSVATPMRRPSVRIRRTPSARAVPTTADPSTQSQSRSATLTQPSDDVEANRRRSSSEPQRPGWFRTSGAPSLARSTTGGGTQGTQLPCVMEEGSAHDAGTLPTLHGDTTGNLAPPTAGPDGVMRRLSVGARSAWRRRSRVDTTTRQDGRLEEEEMDPEIVDWLDVVGEYCSLFHLNTTWSY